VVDCQGLAASACGPDCNCFMAPRYFGWVTID
jgi:hypothetical protein